VVTKKTDPHRHDLPRPRRWHANARVYACYCGELFVCLWDGCPGGGMWSWHSIGELKPPDV